MAATIVVVTGAVLPVFLIGSLGVQVREDLRFGESGLGAATAAFFSAAALTSFVFGRMAERVGPTRSMRLSAVLSGLTLLAIAAGARSWGVLLVILLAGGVANSLAQPATNLFVARTLPPHRQGLAFAVKQSAIPAATLLGGIAVPVFALTVGWRWAFVAGALLSLGALLLISQLPDHVTTAARAAGQAVGTPDSRIAALAVLGTGVGLGAAAAGSLGTFFVSSGVDAGVSRGLAGLLASAGSALCVVTRLVLGARADTGLGRPLPTVAAMLAAGAAGYVAVGIGNEAVLIAVTPVVFAAGWGWPGLFNLAVVLANPTAPAAATGVTQTGTYIGAVLGPLCFGFVADHATYGWAWITAGAMAALASLCIILGTRLLHP